MMVQVDMGQPKKTTESSLRRIARNIRHHPTLANRARSLGVSITKVLGGTKTPLFVDHPPEPRVRYGRTHPPHQGTLRLIEAHRDEYKALLERFLHQKDNLARIDSKPPLDEKQPYWNNGWIGGVNAMALYCLLAMRNPARYVEVGSGNSTKFACRSVKDNDLRTKITSIDPQPRTNIEGLYDDVHKAALEDIDLSMFDCLAAGDIIFFDGSHRCLQNSDVTVFFMEILPELPTGVIVYVDDIYLPYDYPESWADRWYSEQYILAVMMQADGGRRYRTILPHVFIERDPDLSAFQSEVCKKIGVNVGSGNGIWLEIGTPT